MAAHRAEDEQETKVTLPPRDLEKVFNALTRKAGGTGAVRHKYHPRDYHDTEDLDLYRHPNKASLRVQYVKGSGGKTGAWEQTVKFELPHDKNTAAGAMVRREAKDDLPTHRPDVSAVNDAGARKVVACVKGKPLKHIFTAAIERRYFNLNMRSGKSRGTVEVAFDTGWLILAGTGETREISEIEVEIKKGSPRAIDALCADIMKIAPNARIQLKSKADQGIEMYLKSIGK
jgi:inorganic triphosphatase YgiF